MNLLRLGPKLDEGEWEVLWYAASYYAKRPFFGNSRLVSRTPTDGLVSRTPTDGQSIPKTELLMLNVDVMIQALQNRMRHYSETISEKSALKKLLALKELEKRP